MGLTATMYRVRVDLADVDRGIYETLDLRIAKHPSESMPFFLTRTLAYCLCYEEGIAFGRGVSTADEPAVWVKDLEGRVKLWIEVGTPSAKRLHKASKAVPRVVVFTHHSPELLKKEVSGEDIRRLDQIEVYRIPTAFLEALEPLMDRNVRWELVRNDHELYVTINGRSVSGTLTRHALAEPRAT